MTDIEKLNDVYQQILGDGVAIQDDGDDNTGKSTGPVDQAYVQEDYSDDAEDGTDPRDPSTFQEEEDGEERVLDDEEADIDDDGEADLDGEEYEEIPQYLIDAGRRANIADDEIVEIAEKHPEVLEALARSHESRGYQPLKEQPKAQDEPKRTPLKGYEPLKLELSEDEREEFGEQATGVIDSLVKRVNELGEKVHEQGSVTQSFQKESTNQKIQQIDTVFDELSKEIPALGKASSLTDEQKANRIFAFNSARASIQAYGDMPIREALAKGANALRGQQTETEVKKKLIRDLDKNKKRFSPRPRGQRRPGAKRSVEQRALASINKILDSDEYN
jgi:hypothetical protein